MTALYLKQALAIAHCNEGRSEEIEAAFNYAKRPRVSAGRSVMRGVIGFDPARAAI